MAKTVYFDTSVFIEMAAKKSPYKKSIKRLIEELSEEKIRIYTSIITVQEMSVAVYRKGSMTKDTYGDIHALARIYSVTKEVALTAAHREAELKDLGDVAASKRSPKKPETEDEKIEKICENRRRRWDCFHLATAQAIGCSIIYSTDDKLQKRPGQMGLMDLKVIPPKPTEASIVGPLFPKL